jgi:hypothetical protein
MSLFTKLSSKGKKQNATKVANAENAKEQEITKPKPHAENGCCGSCGGQKGKGL